MSNPYPPFPGPEDPRQPGWSPAPPPGQWGPPSGPGGYGYGDPSGYYGHGASGGYGYGAPQPPYYQPTRTNNLAVVGMVLSLVGIPFAVCCGIFGVLLPLSGAVCGHVALGQIRHSGENGRGFALTAVIVGWLLVALVALLFLLALGTGAARGIFGF